MTLFPNFSRLAPLTLALGLGGCLLFHGSPPARGEWNLVWSDEFNGSAVDPNHWSFDVGNGGPALPGWGNNELQYYTSRPQNVAVSNGLLHVMARKETYSGFEYTSGRLKTQGLFKKTYGRFEFRARLPKGQGYWPALWMLPQDSVYGGWAASGEIDVMENRGSNPTNVLGTIHFGGSWPNNEYSRGPSFNFPAGDSVTNFHLYSLEWTTNALRWYVDHQLFQTQTVWRSTGGAYPAPFNQPFYLLMNLAVGGNFGGNPDGTTVFPGEMEVDYVRVYDQTPPLRLTLTNRPQGTLILTWPTNIQCRLQSRTNLTNPAETWQALTTATNPFVAQTTSGGSRFFRLISP